MKFSPANTKLQKLQKRIGKRIYSFDLPSGYTCPFAKECKSMAVADGEKMRIKDGPDCLFRCYSASQEALYKATHLYRMRNYHALHGLTRNAMSRVLFAAIPKKAEVIRIHTSGDFFNRDYLEAWIDVALSRQDLEFYCYSKCVPWVKAHEYPENLRITLSYGGTHDNLIDDWPSSTVVYGETDLPVDVDDYHCYKGEKSFALMLHGIQPRGSGGNRHTRQT